MSFTPWAPPAPKASGRGFALLAPLAVGVLCAVLVLRDHLLAAVVVAAFLGAFLQARLVSPTFARRFDARLGLAAAAFGRGAAAVVSWTLLAVVFVIVFLPAALLSLVRRRPLGRPRSAAPGWLRRDALGPEASSHRTFGVEPGGVGPTRLGLVGGLVATLAIFVVVDLLAGAVLLGTGWLPGDRGDIGRDVRQAVATTMDAPAIRDEPWAQQFGEDMADFELGPDHFVPYLIRGISPFTSPYLNTTDRERRSYEPEASEDPVRVAFFGGSVMFGVGQRDEHTIPSAFARIAEEEGIPIEVHNYGFPGWVAWQELQYLERLLADGETYDLVVFYDGFNEFLVQSTDYSTNPTHLGTAVLQGFSSEFHSEHEAEPGFFDGLRTLGSAYAENSAVGRIIDRLRGDDAHAPPLATPEEQARAALDVYGRAGRLIDDLAADHGVAVHHFWQAQRAGWPPEVIDRLPAAVTDISGIFDGREDEVYIDEVHTNEPGAREVAEAMWAELGPVVRGLAEGGSGS